MKPKKPIWISVPTQGAASLEDALAHLRAEVQRSPQLKIRLKRLARLFAGGRALKLTGDASDVQAFERAVRGYAATQRPREVFSLNDLSHLPEGGLHLTWCRPDGWPLCEYHVQWSKGTDEPTLHVTGQDGCVRRLSAKAFLGLFSSSTHPLYAPQGWRPTSLSGTTPSPTTPSPAEAA